MTGYTATVVAINSQAESPFWRNGDYIATLDDQGGKRPPTAKSSSQ